MADLAKSPSPTPKTAAAPAAPAPAAPAPALPAPPAHPHVAPLSGQTAPPPAPVGGVPKLTPGLVTGIVAIVLIAVFFVYALVRARRRRRAEIAGEPDEAMPARKAEPEALEPGVPAQAPPAEGGSEAEAHTEKERRRQAFLEQQRVSREAKEEERAEKAAAQAEARAEAEAEEQRKREEEEARRQRLLAPSGSLTQSLSKTRGGFVARLDALLGKPASEDVLEEMEEVLFTADIGVHTATRILDAVRKDIGSKGTGDAARLREAIEAEVKSILSIDGRPGGDEALDLAHAGEKPYVLMVVGVNGVGKTTTIGKLAGRLAARGKKVVLAAGDTFRAAAVEQLEVWAERAGAEVVKGGEGADPASVIFDAVEHAKAEGADVVIADTAGRLHTKVPLMAELEKVHRVMGKAREGAPDDVLLVVDATTGQNAVQQAKLFREAVPLTGIALTKLDGTAKGGVIIGICDELSIPVRYIGVGEKIGDLQPFDPAAFVEALFG